jgi:outer membrane lipoprotein SlyB
MELSTLRALALATASVGIALPSLAADAAQTANGVKLASICAGCGVVAEVRTETRKGKGSGVGAVGGAVAGGVVGHQLGGGGGKTALTVLGAVGGGLAGNEVEKRMKKHTVWVATLTLKDGTRHNYDLASDPGVKPGDVVRRENGRLIKQ